MRWGLPGAMATYCLFGMFKLSRDNEFVGSVRARASSASGSSSAAGLAGVGSGFWDRPEDFLDALGEGRVFRPGPDAADLRERAMSDWRRAIRALLSWTADA